MKTIKTIGWILLPALLLIQFIHPEKNISEGSQPNYIGNAHTIPADVKTILDKACMDCHSNNTKYPWYSKIQPVDWWLADHVNEGKRHLNFDEYTNRSLRYQFHKMEETIEMVQEGEMPLNSYTWTHTDAQLTAGEKAAITGWAQNVMDTMKARHPIDSLVKKKVETEIKEAEKKERD